MISWKLTLSNSKYFASIRFHHSIREENYNESAILHTKFLDNILKKSTKIFWGKKSRLLENHLQRSRQKRHKLLESFQSSSKNFIDINDAGSSKIFEFHWLQNSAVFSTLVKINVNLYQYFNVSYHTIKIK